MEATMILFCYLFWDEKSQEPWGSP